MAETSGRWAELRREFGLDWTVRATDAIQGTAGERTDQYLALSVGVLELLNSGASAAETISQLLELVQDATDFEAVGLRLEQSADYPYHETRGFSDAFAEAEGTLRACARDGVPLLDDTGAPALCCMCGTVIRGRGDCTQSFFTTGGSFWTNSSAELLRSTTNQPWLDHGRRRCHGDGYQSMALVPLRSSGGVIGLLQLNDRRCGRLTLRDVHLLERIGASVGIALARRQTEERLGASETILRATLESLPFDFFMVGEDGRYRLQNSACQQHWGNVVGQRPEDMAPNAAVRALWEENNQRAFSGETVRGVVEYSFQGRAGHFYNIIGPVYQDGTVCGILGLNLEITDRVRAENEARELAAQLQRVQKHESLGTLAGRLAHDFNNLLAGVGWNADLALHALPTDSPARVRLGDIRDIVEAAAELTAQLRAYCGKTGLVRRVLDLNDLVQGAQPLLRGALRDRAELVLDCPAEALPVEGDRSQLGQVLTNLVVNAAEAIGDRGGEVRISTCALSCDRPRLDRFWPDARLPEGSYAALEVGDSGPGIEPATVERMFDPFFTTKSSGRGLGLATVQGIVRSHGGAIEVDTRPGHGTVFRVLLPRVTVD